jgi:hypothetical protein
MKIRTGFVSNSSSSSFILALSDEKECEHCGYSNTKMLDLIVTLFSKGTPLGDFLSSYVSNPDDCISMINEEIAELDRDIEWILKRINVLEKLSANDDAIVLFSQWNDIQKNPDVRQKRYVEESGFSRSPYEHLKLHIEWLGDDIKRAKNKKAKLGKKRAKIEAVANSGRMIYSFKIDYQDQLHSVIKDIIESGYVEVIEETRT